VAGPRKKKPAKVKSSEKGMSTKAFSQEAAQLRRGMPAADSVRAVADFVSPQNVKYKILKTTEMDSYDPVSTPRPKRQKKS
jgi:hypothetical protein